ncbi:hypothetical protein NPIL_436001 [Nephila pilipes]|uniref:Uncharacterized protein n=1 Tax=Nephila pilipes TaxID=299642 RepID=A0A8X6PWM8_NEPPI|nr:hypothetical protein NPIL_366571 [Nephila pilipes]GFT87161.1 hypothetical protein NPIL_436001 [Nephila pilipes]
MERRRLSLSEPLKMLQELQSESELDNVDSSDTKECVPDPLEQLNKEDVLDGNDVSDVNDVLDETDYMDLSHSRSSILTQIPTWNLKVVI